MPIQPVTSVVAPSRECPMLPSATAAVRLLRGDPRGLPEVLGTMAVRTAIAATGMYLAGRREDLWKYAAAGVISLEASILLWMAAKGVGDPSTCVTLPTAPSAQMFLRGESPGIPLVIRDVLVRSGELGIGMWLAGDREELMRDALSASLAIQAFVLAYTAYLERR